MSTFSKSVLSGSTNGLSIAVAATASPGTTIHTGPTATTSLHEVWLWASNYSSTPQVLTLEWGGTETKDRLSQTVSITSGLQLITPGLVLSGNATPVVIKAYANVTNNISIVGFVNVIA